MSPIIPELAIIFLLTIVNGLFAMSEVALLAARKGQVQSQASQGNERAGTALVRRNGEDRHAKASEATDRNILTSTGFLGALVCK